MRILLQTSDVRVSEDDTRIVFARRARGPFIAALACATTSALFLAIAPLAEGVRHGAASSLLRWSGAIVGGGSILLALRAIIVAFATPTSLDVSAGAMRVGRMIHPLDRVRRIRHRRVALASLPLLEVIAELDTETLVLAEGIPGEHEQTVERIANLASSRLRAYRDAQPAQAPATAPEPQTLSPEDEALDAEVADRITRRFMCAFFIVLGLAWSAVGYVVMPRTLFTHQDRTFGFLVWPLGLTLAPLGLLELAGISPLKFLVEAPKWKAVLVGLAWFTPYLIFSYRPL